jgi:hypothetical protein
VGGSAAYTKKTGSPKLLRIKKVPTTDWIAWFRYQLTASAEGFTWAFARIEPQFRLALPPDPDYFGTWPAARLIWHVTEYERCLALPSMRQWLGGPKPESDSWHDEDPAWEKASRDSLDILLERFTSIRQAQINLLDQLQAVDWELPRPTGWGLQPLSMIVTKTFQHTWEHGDTLLRMAIWWKDKP